MTKLEHHTEATAQQVLAAYQPTDQATGGGCHVRVLGLSAALPYSGARQVIVDSSFILREPLQLTKGWDFLKCFLQILA